MWFVGVLLIVCIVPVVFAAGGVLLASRGVFGDPEIKTNTYEEPSGNADSATVDMLVGTGTLQLASLNDSANLFEADISYVGNVTYDVNGDTHREIALRQTAGQLDLWGVLTLWGFNGNTGNNPMLWTVNLARNVPLDLSVEGGVGDLTLDLSEIQLEGLHLKMGVGNADVTLPSLTTAYAVTIEGGVGRITITLPQDLEARVTANQGVGQLSMPARLARTSGSDNNIDVAQSGVWETPGYANAQARLTLTYDNGVGNLIVR
jgi:hypothetical protein